MTRQLGSVILRIRRLVGPGGVDQTGDARLLERFRAGRDEEAFGLLMRRHGPMVLGLCRRTLQDLHDAEDVYQATFLVFARKADMISRGESVAGWLYRVAYRLALRARAQAGRRRAIPHEVAAMQVEPEASSHWGDLRSVLDEEIQRLPAKYRDSVVVRYLEGKSNKEAARLLGLPLGSMSWRLSQALDLLRRRLARRGVTLTAALLASALAEAPARASVPLALEELTLQASLSFVPGNVPAATPVTVRVMLLVESGLQAMFMQKLWSAAFSVLALIIVVGMLGILAYPLLAHSSLDADNAGGSARHAKPAEALRSPAVAAELGLQWLARQQAADGHWDLENPNATAATAFGLLPFLVIGETHQQVGFDHPYARTVSRGLKYLVGTQQVNGDLGGGIYGHGLAAWVLAEAYRLTGDPALKEPAQNALNYIVQVQHAQGGWRYTVGMPGDTSVSSWHIMALSCGRRGGLQVPDKTLQNAGVFLDSVAAKDGKGYGYLTPQPTPTMTAAGLASRLALGGNPEDFDVSLLMKLAPSSQYKNLYYYHWATRALQGGGGEGWKTWEPKMRQLLLAGQELAAGDDQGSWSPAGDAFGSSGGRLMVTSLALVTLQLCGGEELQIPKASPQDLKPDELGALWDDLADTRNNYKARLAIATLAASPKHSVAYLATRLEPVPKADAQRIGRLIGELDSASFADRQRAAEELEQLQDLAEPALRKVLDDKPSLEVRQRVERLLQRLEDRPPAALRSLRAVTVLERLGTPEARQLLEKLAAGTPEALQTREAKAVLDRIAKKDQVSP